MKIHLYKTGKVMLLLRLAFILHSLPSKLLADPAATTQAPVSGTAGYAFASGTARALYSGSDSAVLGSGTNGLAMLGCPPNSVMCVIGTSITRGYGLAGSELSNGGTPGCFIDLLTRSPWAAGNLTTYNAAHNGYTTAQGLAQFAQPQTAYGVTVPSAYSVFTSGSFSGKKYFFIDGSLAINDASISVSSTATISNFLALTASGHSVGATVILITCCDHTEPGYSNAQNTLVLAANKWMESGSSGADFVGSADEWLSDQNNAGLFVDTLHPNNLGHVQLYANLLAWLVSGGGRHDTCSGVIQKDVKVTGGLTVTNEDGTTNTLGNTNLQNTTAATFVASGTASIDGIVFGSYTGYGGNLISLNEVQTTPGDAGIGLFSNYLYFDAPSGYTLVFRPNGLGSPALLLNGTTVISYQPMSLGANSLACGNISSGNLVASGTASIDGQFYFGPIPIYGAAEISINNNPTLGSNVGILTAGGGDLKADATTGIYLRPGGSTNGIFSLTTSLLAIGVPTTISGTTSFTGNSTFSGTVSVGGTLILSGTAAAPANTATPVGWFNVATPKATYKVPAYQ